MVEYIKKCKNPKKTMLKWGELNIIIIMVKNRDVQIKVMKMDKGEITKPKT
jgi:hypothetical protein